MRWPPERSPVPIAYAMLILCMFFSGMNAVVGRYGVAEIPPITLTFWRWAVAFAMLAPFALRDLIAQRTLILRNWKIIVALISMGSVLYNSMFYIALQTTTAVNASLLAGAMPAATVLAAFIVVRERITLRAGVGMALSFLGLVAIIAQGDLAVLIGLEMAVGDLLIMIGVAGWAVYSVILTKRPEGIAPPVFLALMFVVGMIVISPFYALEIAAGRTFELTLSNIGVILFAGVLVSALSNMLWIGGLVTVGPSTAGQFNYLIPVFGAGLAVLLLGEEFRLYHFAGMVLVLGGVFLAVGRAGGAVRPAAESPPKALPDDEQTDRLR